MAANYCHVCAEPCHVLARLCPRCKKARNRLDTRAKGRGTKTDKAAREKAMRNAWDSTIRAFRCHYSGVSLDASSPWHLTFDHRTPRDESDIVVCAALVNDMKSDPTEPEFRAVVAQLAEKFAGTRAEIDRIAPEHWRRGAKSAQ